MKKIKILVMEIEPGLGELMRARLEILKNCKITLASTLEKAKEKAKRAKENKIDIAIIGQVARCKGLIEEEKIVKVLKEQPKIIVINYSGGKLEGMDMQIKRPEGALKIEEIVKDLLIK